MKKTILPFLALAALLLASCDTKDCRCYHYNGNRWTGPSTELTSTGTRCESLNTSSTYCNEMDDPILDPNDIAIGKK